jgi:hypothetical protein
MNQDQDVFKKRGPDRARVIDDAKQKDGGGLVEALIEHNCSVNLAIYYNSYNMRHYRKSSGIGTRYIFLFVSLLRADLNRRCNDYWNKDVRGNSEIFARGAGKRQI